MDMKDSPAASHVAQFHPHILFYCTILHFSNKIWEDELLVFVSACILAIM